MAKIIFPHRLAGLIRMRELVVLEQKRPVCFDMPYLGYGKDDVFLSCLASGRPEGTSWCSISTLRALLEPGSTRWCLALFIH